MSSRHNLSVIGLAIVLAAVGTALILLRLNSRKSVEVPAGSFWSIGYEFSFTTERDRQGIRAAIPHTTRACEIVRESFSRSNLELNINRDPVLQEREIVCVAPPGKHRFHARFQLRLDERRSRSLDDVRESLTPERRAHYLRSEERIQLDSPVVERVVDRLVDIEDGGPLLDRLARHAAGLGRSEKGSDAEAVLAAGAGNARGRARALIALCRGALIPARPVVGFVLEPEGPSATHLWVEAYEDGEWHPFDPEFGRARRLPASYLPLRRGDDRIVRPDGPMAVKSRFSVREQIPPPRVLGPEVRSSESVFDLARMSPELQESVVFLLLMPVGGLVVAAFRSFLRVTTFGYFTPVLIALSFVHASWKTGLAIFAIVTTLGITGRAAVDRLNLTKRPRLTLVMVVVGGALAFTISLLDLLDIGMTARGVLVPVIAMTFMVEGFHQGAQRNGYRFALRRFGGTLLVSACCLAMFRVGAIQDILLNFPETELFVAAAAILVGRYRADEPPGQDDTVTISTLGGAA